MTKRQSKKILDTYVNLVVRDTLKYKLALLIVWRQSSALFTATECGISPTHCLFTLAADK